MKTQSLDQTTFDAAINNSAHISALAQAKDGAALKAQEAKIRNLLAGSSIGIAQIKLAASEISG